MTENVSQPRGDATVTETVPTERTKPTANTDQDVDPTDSSVPMVLVAFQNDGSAMERPNVAMVRMKLDVHKKVSVFESLIELDSILQNCTYRYRLSIS